ncbi:hypothetical protein B6K69_17500 (plasmid) [Fuscovulum blasticum]|nr:hypothetical protein B6K69_17500 [Fuscovulum blasticum]
MSGEVPNLIECLWVVVNDGNIYFGLCLRAQVVQNGLIVSRLPACASLHSDLWFSILKMVSMLFKCLKSIGKIDNHVVGNLSVFQGSHPAIIVILIPDLDR